MSNSNTWINIYETSDFGNEYPSSYLVTLFHSRIKSILLETGKKIHEINVLDFGCSKGANSNIFIQLGMQTYGIDISAKAVDSIKKRMPKEFQSRFRPVNLLDCELDLEDVFPGVKFDFIIASECLYYFTDCERNLLIGKFIRGMSEDAVLYVSTPTYDMQIYRAYKTEKKDDNGMIEVFESGRIKDHLLVNLPRNIEEFSKMVSPFLVVDIMTVNQPIYSNSDNIEYHMIAKRPKE